MRRKAKCAVLFVGTIFVSLLAAAAVRSQDCNGRALVDTGVVLQPTTAIATAAGSVTATTANLYSVEVCEAGTYTFTFCSGGGGANYDTWLCLLDDCQQLLAQVDDSCGLLSELVALLPRGTYFLSVSGFSASAGSYTLAYSANVANHCPASCNGRSLSFAGAIRPELNFATVTGTVTPTSAQVWSVTAAEAGTYTFTFCSGGGSAAFDTWLCLYDGGFNPVAENSDVCGVSSQIVRELDEGEYFLAVSGFGGNAGAYTLAHCVTLDAPVLCNGRALTSGGEIRPSLTPQAVSGSVSVTSGQYYTFVVETPGTYTLTFCSGCASATYDTWLCLYDAVWTPLAENDDACGLASEITAALAPGTYHIAVSAFGGNAGDYALSYSRTITCNGRTLSRPLPSEIHPISDARTEFGSVTPTTGTVYVVNVCQPGSYLFTFCGLGGAAAYDSWLCLLSSGGRIIAQNDDHCGLASELLVPLERGTYLLAVSGFSDSAGTYTLAYAAGVPNGCAPSCNSRRLLQRETIYPSEVVKTIYGETPPTSGNFHDFSVTTPSFCTFTLCSGGGSASYDSFLCLQERCGGLIAENDDTCGLSSEVSAALLPGDYTVSVTGFSDGSFGSYCLAYSLEPMLTCNDRFLESAGSITPTGVPATVSGSVTTTTGDSYTVTIPAAGNYTFTMCSAGGTSDYDAWLCLLDAAGDVVAENDDTCGLLSALSLCLQPGTYTLAVSGFSDSIGSYTLAYFLARPGCAGRCLADRGAISPGMTPATVSGSVTPAEGTIYTVSVATAGSYRFTFCAGGGSASFDTWLCVFASDGSLLADNDNSCGLASDLTVCLAPGTYGLGVSGAGGPGGASGAYTLAYFLSAPACNRRCFTPRGPIAPAAAPATVGGSVAAGGGDMYTFTLAAESTCKFTFCSSGGTADYDTWLCLFDAGFHLITQDDDACEFLSEIIVTLPAGTYSIAVSGFGSSAGSYTLAYSGAPPGPGIGLGLGPFIRCDFNCSGAVDISDSIAMLSFLFLGGAASCCSEVELCNPDASFDLSDPVFALNHLFSGGPAPQTPFPGCGGSGCAPYSCP